MRQRIAYEFFLTRLAAQVIRGTTILHDAVRFLAAQFLFADWINIEHGLLVNGRLFDV